MDTLEEGSSNIHNITVYDSTTIKWSTFPWANGFYKHAITSVELIKPYLISWAYYGDVSWEYVLLLLNNIADIEDVPVGTIINIPKLQDLKDFLLANKK
jgi:hypothetical protein